MNELRRFFILTIISSYSGFLFSQINIEKLQYQLSNYNLVDSSVMSFSLVHKTFASTDSTDLYRIIYNSNNIITNPPVFGNAILHIELDTQGRILLSTPYLANGELSNSITYQYNYFDSISMVQINHLTNKGQLASRLEKTLDQDGRLIEKRHYDKNLSLEFKITYEFDDVKHLRTEKQYDSLSNLLKNECGVALTIQKFPSSGYEENYLTILEERFYDNDMNLVDCSKHFGNGFMEPFSQVQRIHEGSNVREIRYNAKNEIVSNEIIEFKN